jgi:hypothetical protein
MESVERDEIKSLQHKLKFDHADPAFTLEIETLQSLNSPPVDRLWHYVLPTWFHPYRESVAVFHEYYFSLLGSIHRTPHPTTHNSPRRRHDKRERESEMSTKPKKYIFVNGIMKQNPEFDAYMKALNGGGGDASGVSATNSLSPSAPPMDQPLAVVSSLSDITEATTLQAETTGVPMQVAQSTMTAMENMQDENYLNAFHSSQDVDGGELLEGLTEYFIQYEVPVGLLHKLFALKAYRLNFIVDDSGTVHPLPLFLSLPLTPSLSLSLSSVGRDTADV